MTDYSANPFAVHPRGHFADLNVSHGEYHSSCDGISNSMLSVFLDDPALFEGRYLSKRFPAPPPSPEFEFGALVHSVLLEEGLSKIKEIPSQALAKDGSRRGAAWQSFQLDHADKVLLKPEEIAPLRAIWANANRCPLVSQLLYRSRGANECSFEWIDDDTGLLLKMRLDRWTEPHGSWPALIVDVKTTAACDPQSFAAACWRWGYHRQSAFYRAGVKALEGAAPPFVFVAARKTAPYTVRAYDLSEDFLALGESEVRLGLARLAACRDTRMWSDSTAGQILTLDAPRYAYYDEWSLK